MIGQGEGPLEMPGASTEEMLQYKLTAAEEQLAEMRGLFEAIGSDLIDWFVTHWYREPQGPGAESCPKSYVATTARLKLAQSIEEALSAAPKHGRVLWEGKGKIQLVGPIPDEPWTKIELEAGSLWGIPAKKIQFELLDTPIEDGQSVTVTVREAE